MKDSTLREYICAKYSTNSINLLSKDKRQPNLRDRISTIQFAMALYDYEKMS